LGVNAGGESLMDLTCLSFAVECPAKFQPLPMHTDRLNELRELLPNCLRQDGLRMASILDHLLKSGRSPSELAPKLDRLCSEAKRSIALRHWRHENLPRISYPPALPITARREDIIAAIRAHQVVVIAGETGSGKTTQLPKMCLEAGLGVEGKIGCTQPRRVAALSISRRIAEELHVPWGKEVGCKIRFSDRSSPETYVKLMTDGILLAETQGDPDLNEYDAIVIDEAHERSLNIDFLLGHLRLLLDRRPELKLVITSATIDTEAFSKAFGNAPILEVSGRLFPVEIRHAPLDHDAEEAGEKSYIDAAVEAVEAALYESPGGDILIFMPGERDIRETQDLLEGRHGPYAEVIPLFGRLTSGEQERVFAPSSRRKIIISTNIAETSLTIPGIRYVIDAGLARISRYNPRTRTRRLPIEPIAQSSANQRAGRSGRVENGVCIRLYSEEEFEERPKFTQPEIQRSNLAEVILRMKAWRLGEVETFPFINPPSPQAIQSGYQLLQELGALDKERQLTPLGRELARLPVDPSIGRMVLQSIHEKALPEVLVIAAGLSIQDPRDRPSEKQQEADHAHRQFLDPDSDFLALLNIWNAFHDRLESLKTQNQMRKFCKANYLSYIRMREWIDVHSQLSQALREVVDRSAASNRSQPEKTRSPQPERRAPSPAPSALEPAQRTEGKSTAKYAGIHRSILSGLLGHIAHRKERNFYRAPGNREIMVWPGSSLFDRVEKKKPSRTAAPPPNPDAAAKSKQPEWVVAGEILETARLYARTIAAVQPEWVAELGDHICKRSYADPIWNRKAGRVLVRERISIFGLELFERNVDFGKVDPTQATEMFIQSALVEEEIDQKYRFLEQNRQLRQKIEQWRTRARNHRLKNTDDLLFGFYARQLSNVSSVHDLNRVLREKFQENPHFLCATEQELAGGQELSWDGHAFPNEIEAGGQRVQVDYAYAPGEDHDGTTIRIPAVLAPSLQAETFDWAIPGLREEQIECLLKSLPKSQRVPLMPIAPKVKELAAALKPGDGLQGLSSLIRTNYGLQIPASAWSRDVLPNHLRPRVAIIGNDQKPVAADRNFNKLKQGLAQHQSKLEDNAWTNAVEQWERYDLTSWSFNDLPERIEVGRVNGAPLAGFPGLQKEENTIHLRLFRTRKDAEDATRAGFAALVELAIQKDLAWAQKDLRALQKLQPLFLDWISAEEFIATACLHLKRHLIKLPDPLLPLAKTHFDLAIEEAKRGLPGFVPQLIDRVTEILKLRQQVVSHRAFPKAAVAGPAVLNDLKQLGAARPPAGQAGLAFLREELDKLVPPRFLQNTSFERLAHYPRYLKALLIRADRALLNPVKDQEKAKQILPFAQALRELEKKHGEPTSARFEVEQFRSMIEELKVSLFAQELGTAQPISPKRLQAQLENLQNL
jgi:ATP-dependent helicase HrpA